MSQQAKREYLEQVRERYRNASKREKGLILNEFCKVCGYTRKHAIRKLRSEPKMFRVKPGPRPIYGSELVEILVQLWNCMRRICSKKMHAAMPHWLDHTNSPMITSEIRLKLLRISPASIDRLLAPVRKSELPKGLSSTRAGSFRKTHIPIRVHHWEVTKPGYVQADTVAHCGDSLSGAHANTLTITDIDSTWTENRAVWTKGSYRVFQQIRDIEQSLPFPIVNYSADNGGEVLNQRLYSYFYENRKEGERVQMTRSRPYRKNDQAHVEQKNNSHVRQLFGYERVEHPDLVDLMNDIYRNCWNPLQNFFTPSMKLIRKTRIGARIKKEYDKPKTPYQRLLDSTEMKEEAKQALRLRYQSLNPFDLSKELERKLERFFYLVKRKKLWQVA